MRPQSARQNASGLYAAVDRFTIEVALLFFAMREAATAYVGQGEHSAGRRSILRSLSSKEQGVPEMARERAVSRQHVQKLVDGLIRDRLVYSRQDPGDQRSRVMSLTPRGRAVYRALRDREVRLFSDLGRGLPLEGLEQATELIQQVRLRLLSKKWRAKLRGRSGAVSKRLDRLQHYGWGSHEGTPVRPSKKNLR